MKFTDATGAEWNVRITVGTLGRVRRDTGTDLGAALRSEAALSELLFSEPGKLGEVIHAVCSAEAKARGISPEAFAEVLDGPAVAAAVQALLGAVADFFPLSPVAAAIRRNLVAVTTAIGDAAAKEIDRQTGEIGTPKPADGNSPASADSTPAPSPSAS